MKLKQISENLVSKLGKGLHGAGYFNRSFQHTQSIYNSGSGHDAGSRTAGYSNMVTGVPTNPRHRQFLGFQKRLGAIRL